MNTASEKKRSIYVLMTRTGTGPARVIRLFSRMEYNHASISGDAALNQLYSFCRNYTYVPFPASLPEAVNTSVQLSVIRQALSPLNAKAE